MFLVQRRKGAFMHFRPVWIVIVLGSRISSAFAAVVPVPDVEKLTEQSTLIVVGELTSTQRDIRATTVDFNNRRINVRVQRGTFRIDQVVKGDHQPSSVTVEFACRIRRLVGAFLRSMLMGCSSLRIRAGP